MSEKPILFNSEILRAILADRKTQTRRIAKLPEKWHRGKAAFKNNPHGDEEYIIHGDCGTLNTYCPYGRVGDRLWVRETWRCTGGGDLRNIIYKAEGDTAMSFCGVDDGRTGILHVPEPHWEEWDRLVYGTKRGCNWRSPIHMYKWACRIWLKITGIRVEMLKEISDNDIICEGFETREDFYGTIIKINRAKNPEEFLNKWVWAIEFKRIEKG